MMKQPRSKLQRAWRLMVSGSLEWIRSDAVSGRIQRFIERLRHDPILVRPETYLKTNIPRWKALQGIKPVQGSGLVYRYFHHFSGHCALVVDWWCPGRS